jgi:hypothetical protein
MLCGGLRECSYSPKDFQGKSGHSDIMPWTSQISGGSCIGSRMVFVSELPMCLKPLDPGQSFGKI